MKKFLLVLISFTTLNIAFAQSSVGLQAGVNRSHFWGAEVWRQFLNTITCPSFGAVLNKGVTKHLSLSTGINYEMTGSGKNNDWYDAPSYGYGKSVKGDMRVELNYLSIPVIVNYDFGKKKAFGVGGGLHRTCSLQKTSLTMIHPVVGT